MPARKRRKVEDEDQWSQRAACAQGEQRSCGAPSGGRQATRVGTSSDPRDRVSSLMAICEILTLGIVASFIHGDVDVRTGARIVHLHRLELIDHLIGMEVV